MTKPLHSFFQASRDATCRCLADGLRRNTFLINLNIGGNSLTADGAQLLMQAVSVHPSLKSLSFEHDECIGLSGIKSIGMALPHTHLKELRLSGMLPGDWPKPQNARIRRDGKSFARRSSTEWNLDVFRFFCDYSWQQLSIPDEPNRRRTSSLPMVLRLSYRVTTSIFWRVDLRITFFHRCGRRLRYRQQYIV